MKTLMMKVTAIVALFMVLFPATMEGVGFKTKYKAGYRRPIPPGPRRAIILPIIGTPSARDYVVGAIASQASRQPDQQGRDMEVTSAFMEEPVDTATVAAAENEPMTASMDEGTADMAAYAGISTSQSDDNPPLWPYALASVAVVGMGVRYERRRCQRQEQCCSTEDFMEVERVPVTITLAHDGGVLLR